MFFIRLLAEENCIKAYFVYEGKPERIVFFCGVLYEASIVTLRLSGDIYGELSEACLGLLVAVITDSLWNNFISSFKLRRF